MNADEFFGLSVLCLGAFVTLVIVIPWLAIRAHDNRPGRGLGAYPGHGPARSYHERMIGSGSWGEQVINAAILVAQRHNARQLGPDVHVRVPRGQIWDADVSDHLAFLDEYGPRNGVYIDWSDDYVP